MKQVSGWAFVLAAVCAGAVAAQGVKVTTIDDHDKAMKTISTNARQVPKLLEANALDAVKKRYGTIREQFAGVEGCCAGRSKPEVAMLARNANEKVDLIIKAVDAGDRAGIDAGIKQLVAACAACHDKYREPDPAVPNSFVIKKGVL